MNMRRKVFLILTILWMVMIFSFSARPAEISSEDSRNVGLLIGEIFIPGFEGWSAEEQNAFAEKGRKASWPELKKTIGDKAYEEVISTFVLE